MKKLRNENQLFLTSFIKQFSVFAFGMRNRLLYRVYIYFRKNNLPIQDLADIAEMSRAGLYNNVSIYVKSTKEVTK